MKNQYVGDINDYGKYIILRVLSDVGLRLAICWMLTPNDNRPDGRKVTYLNSNEHLQYCPEIFYALRKIVLTGRRHVKSIESAGILPGTQYYNHLSELNANRDADLLFLDPDNGFEIKSIVKGKRGSERYVFWDDVDNFYADGFSLMVYQHFPRVNRIEYMNKLNEKIKARIGTDSVIHIQTGNVDFVILYQLNHQGEIETAIKEIKRLNNFFQVRE